MPILLESFLFPKSIGKQIERNLRSGSPFRGAFEALRALADNP